MMRGHGMGWVAGILLELGGVASAHPPHQPPPVPVVQPVMPDDVSDPGAVVTKPKTTTTIPKKGTLGSTRSPITGNRAPAGQELKPPLRMKIKAPFTKSRSIPGATKARAKERILRGLGPSVTP